MAPYNSWTATSRANADAGAGADAGADAGGTTTKVLEADGKLLSGHKKNNIDDGDGDDDDDDDTAVAYYFNNNNTSSRCHDQTTRMDPWCCISTSTGRSHDGSKNSSNELLSLGGDLMDSEKNNTDRMFSQWDVDASGYLDMEEVIDGVKALCCEEGAAALSYHVDDCMITSLFHHVDNDRNQVLDKMEFSLLLDAVANQLGLEAEDLVIIAANSTTTTTSNNNNNNNNNNSLCNRSREETGSGTDDKAWKLPCCNPLVMLLHRTRQRWVALSSNQRARMSDTVRTVMSRISSQEGDDSRSGSTDDEHFLSGGAPDEFTDRFEGDDDSKMTVMMWIPMEIVETRAQSSS